jgi:hypothetical protein
MSSSERRARFRVGVRGWACWSGGDPDEYRVADLSLGGVHLIGAARAEARTAGRLSLRVLAQTLELDARVVWASSELGKRHVGMALGSASRSKRRRMSGMLLSVATRVSSGSLVLIAADERPGLALAERLWTGNWDVVDGPPSDLHQLLDSASSQHARFVLIAPGEGGAFDADEVARLARARCPDARRVLVGAGPTASSELWHGSLQPSGADPAEFLRRLGKPGLVGIGRSPRH